MTVCNTQYENTTHWNNQSENTTLCNNQNENTPHSNNQNENTIHWNNQYENTIIWKISMETVHSTTISVEILHFVTISTNTLLFATISANTLQHAAIRTAQFLQPTSLFSKNTRVWLREATAVSQSPKNLTLVRWKCARQRKFKTHDKLPHPHPPLPSAHTLHVIIHHILINSLDILSSSLNTKFFTHCWPELLSPCHKVFFNTGNQQTQWPR